MAFLDILYFGPKMRNKIRIFGYQNTLVCNVVTIFLFTISGTQCKGITIF